MQTTIQVPENIATIFKKATPYQKERALIKFGHLLQTDETELMPTVEEFRASVREARTFQSENDLKTGENYEQIQELVDAMRETRTAAKEARIMEIGIEAYAAELDDQNAGDAPGRKDNNTSRTRINF